MYNVVAVNGLDRRDKKIVWSMLRQKITDHPDFGSQFISFFKNGDINFLQDVMTISVLNLPCRIDEPTGQRNGRAFFREAVMFQNVFHALLEGSENSCKITPHKTGFEDCLQFFHL